MVPAAAAAQAAPAEGERPLRIAVARPVDAPPRCGDLSADVGAALVDSLRARGVAAVADTTLAAWLRRLDATRFPDPGDYRSTRAYIAETGAKRLVYVNDLRAAETCALAFEAALWNTEPLGRRAARHGEAPDAASAAGLLSPWLHDRLQTETP